MITNVPENASEFELYGIIPYDRINGSYSLILRHTEEQNTMLSIIIGSAEAQSIAIFLEGIDIDRPSIHDLFCNVLMDRSIDVEYVLIDDVHNETFFASMVFNDGTLVNCRPSDAISVAIRLGSPIIINNDVVDSMSFEYRNIKGMKSSNDEQKEAAKKPTRKKKKDESIKIDPADLQKRLQEAIEKEDYELAAKLRDQSPDVL
jgi:bifunctional DNase/RNase